MTLHTREEPMPSMPAAARSVRVAIAGVGNCAAALVEGLAWYRERPDDDDGLLFARLGGRDVRDLEVVTAFDIARAKVGLPIEQAILQAPNLFQRAGVTVSAPARVHRGPTLDGNPEHLARLVPESDLPVVDVERVLREERVDVLVNLLPTGSSLATEHYASAALQAGCSFINAIPTPMAQRPDWQARFSDRGLVLLGDDVKSQLGTTILHRALLALMPLRGARLRSTSQVNIGGNTDFANFVHRAESKLVSKRKSLRRFVEGADCHVGHHYDPTRGPWKNAHIELDATVFAGSRVRIAVRLDSDDKPNCAGSLVDLVRVAHASRLLGLPGVVVEACAFYMKSPPMEMDEDEALAVLRERFGEEPGGEERVAGTVDSAAG
jgi:myo-inositol-1-phosphate synthase